MTAELTVVILSASRDHAWVPHMLTPIPLSVKVSRSVCNFRYQG